MVSVAIHVSSAARPQSARRRQAARGPQEGSSIIQRPSSPKRSWKNFLGRWIYPVVVGKIYRHRKTLRDIRRATPGRLADDHGSLVAKRARVTVYAERRRQGELREKPGPCYFL